MLGLRRVGLQAEVLQLSGLGLHFRHSSPGTSYQVTHSGTQSAKTMGGSVAALSPEPAKRRAPLIKGTRFTQLLQTSKDFLSQKKDPQEGHVLQPHPVSQKCLLSGFKLVSQVTSILPHIQPQTLDLGTQLSQERSVGSRGSGDKGTAGPQATK